MYTVYVDGKLLFDAALYDPAHVILSPKLDVDIHGAGSFSFVLPPGNALYDAIHKLKSIVTVKMDDETIFRGRAMDDEKDFYNQKNVYCEGDKSFLLDSLHKPYRYSGGVQDFFRQLISNHNAQVDADKQFAAGIITAVDAALTMEAKDDGYADTSTRMNERLLGAYGGYLRTRTEGSVTYLDWLTTEGNADAQEIAFSVNLLDLKDKIDASDVFTILIPLGASQINDDGDYSPPLTVASVNGGLDYIQDDEAVALYGKIWRTQTWSYEDDPSKLLEKGREFLKTGISVQSLTLQFIDMHFTDSSRKRVWIGDHPRILSQPHGLDIAPICAKASIDLLNPEKSSYTFGEAPKTLTENIIEAEDDLGALTGGGRRGGGGRGVKDEADAIKRWAYAQALEEEAKYNILTGDVNDLTGRMSTAEIRVDGLEADILLKADRELVNDLEKRVTSAEIDIDGANANILLKADATVVDALGNRVTSAEIKIDGLNSEITLKADKIDLQGYVTATQLRTEFSNFESGISNSLYVSSLSSGTFECSNFNFRGNGMSLGSKKVVTSVGLSKSYQNVPGGDGVTYTVLGGASVSYNTDTIYFMSWG